MFTKEELQRELRHFMLHFSMSMERMFVGDCGGALVGVPGKSSFDLEPEQVRVEKSLLWSTLMRMYDYGVLGLHSGIYGNGHLLDAAECDVEMFLQGLQSMELYLDEDLCRLPRLALRTSQTAVARHVLDGGSRYTLDSERDVSEESGYLSFEELALLADMDTRSVRNAANPKVPDALVTESFGRRTLIAVEDARRWLAGRKGFTPTSYQDAVVPQAPAALSVELSEVLERRIDQAARAENLSAAAFLEKLLNEHGQGAAHE